MASSLSYNPVTSRGLARRDEMTRKWPLLLLLLAALTFSPPGVVTQSHDLVCGTKFHDLRSRALLAPLVLHGHVQKLDPMTSSARDHEEEPLRSAISRSGAALFQAEVKVLKVLKGMELLNSEPLLNGNITNITVFGVGEEEEDKEYCVGHVVIDHSYVFFLRARSPLKHDLSSPSNLLSVSSSVSALPSSPASSAVSPESTSAAADLTTATVPTAAPLGEPYFVNTALPQPMDPKALKTVKKALCPGCASLPIIQRVKCINCATAPVLKRPMSAKETKALRAGRRLSLRCAAKGSPPPAYIWMKDGRVLHDSSSQGERHSNESRRANVFSSGSLRVRFSKQYSLLVVNKMTSDDAGTYSCLVSNPMGEAAQSVKVKVKGQRHSRLSTTPLPTPTTHSDSALTSEAVDLHPCSEPPCDDVPDLSSSSPPTPPALTTPAGEEEEGDEEEDNPCDINPCYNGGSCLKDENHPIRRVRCQCLPEFFGNSCQFRRRTVVAAEEDDAENEESNLGSTGTPEATSQQTRSGIAATTTTTTTTTTFAPSSGFVQQRRLSKKKASKLRRGKGNRRSGNGPPKLEVSECKNQSYCLNSGICKIVAPLQRRFCECVEGFGGRRCEMLVL